MRDTGVGIRGEKEEGRKEGGVKGKVMMTD